MSETKKKAHRLTTVQRMILTFMLDEEARGKPTVIATGHKKTRVGYFPSLQTEGVATNTFTLFFLRHNGLVKEVHGGKLVDVTMAGDQAQTYQGSDIRYRLTDVGRAALKAKP